MDPLSGASEFVLGLKSRDLSCWFLAMLTEWGQVLVFQEKKKEGLITRKRENDSSRFWHFSENDFAQFSAHQAFLPFLEEETKICFDGLNNAVHAPPKH